MLETLRRGAFGRLLSRGDEVIQGISERPHSDINFCVPSIRYVANVLTIEVSQLGVSQGLTIKCVQVDKVLEESGLTKTKQVVKFLKKFFIFSGYIAGIPQSLDSLGNSRPRGLL